MGSPKPFLGDSFLYGCPIFSAHHDGGATLALPANLLAKKENLERTFVRVHLRLSYLGWVQCAYPILDKSF